MKLAVLSAGDPLNIGTWSGTPYFMTQTLLTQFPDLVAVRAPRPVWFRYVRRGMAKGTAGHVDLNWNYWLARRDARHIAARLRAEGVGAAVCIGISSLSAFLAERLPTIHVSDATVPLMVGYYAEFSRLSETLARRAWQLDSLSVLRSRACLFATEWAASSAIRDYKADPSRVYAIPWGANIHARNIPADVATVTHDVCHMVFIGVDWERKGGAIAAETVMRLAARGHAVKLHIIGTRPVLPNTGESIVVHGFINKGTEEGRREFDRIMQQAAFLFVPTRQDCYGMVFPEANSYGIPVITTRTGGVPDVVHEGVNGHLLATEATADAYADLIRAIWSDRSRYERLRNSSRVRFEQALNWNSWLSAAAPIISGVASSTTKEVSKEKWVGMT